MTSTRAAQIAADEINAKGGINGRKVELVARDDEHNPVKTVAQYRELAAFAQFASYALPFAAVFLVWLHAEVLPRGDRTVATAGLVWIAVLAVAGWALVAHDARDESFTVSGPGGSMTASDSVGWP